MCTFCYLSSISAMPLAQINCTNFFFHPISVMPLPQIHSHKFFFFPLNFDNVIVTIPFNFFLSQKNVTNQTVSVKKNTEKIRICVFFFYISPLFQQSHCHKQQNFFFPFYSNSFPHFFPSISAMTLPQTMYFFLFLFLFTALQNKNIVLVFRIYVTFFLFFFCLHHFRIRICS